MKYNPKLNERKVIVIEIEYECSRAGDERAAVFDWLDEKYGKLKWRSRRSGPIQNQIGKGVVVAEVEI